MLVDYENMRLKPTDNYTLNNATIESVKNPCAAYWSFEWRYMLIIDVSIALAKKNN